MGHGPRDDPQFGKGEAVDRLESTGFGDVVVYTLARSRLGGAGVVHYCQASLGPSKLYVHYSGGTNAEGNVC